MKKDIQQLLAGIVKSLFGDPSTLLGAGAEIDVSIPERPEHGDYTTNTPMILAGRLKALPTYVGKQIIDAIKKHQKESRGKNMDWLARAEITPPGFINLWLSNEYFSSQLAEVLEKKDAFGTKEKVISHQSSVISKEEKIGLKQKPVLATKSLSPQSPQLPQLPLSSPLPAGKGAKKSVLASFGNSNYGNERVTREGGPPRRGPLMGVLGGKRAAGPAQNTIMVEFAHPNTHKAFHIGHLRNITTGESIVRLLESQGNRVIRANYQGDVGMHIAKCLYGILQVKSEKFKVKSWEDVKKLPIQERVEYLGEMYAVGSKAFEENETAKGIIIDLNALIYASAQRYAKEVGRDPGTTDYLKLVKNHVHPIETVYELWKETRQWSLDYFETIYKRVGSHYDRLYFESECLAGVDMAKTAVKTGILKESDGAIIFEGKPYGLDTRVFVNSLGLPTYEGKEIKLASIQAKEFGKLDRLIHVLGPEQVSFTKVTFKAEELLGILPAGVQLHLTYGWVKLKHGKMSSRSGVVVLGEWLLDEAKKSIYKILDKPSSLSSRPPSRDPSSKNWIPGQARNDKSNAEEKETIAEAAAIAAVKYAFLRVGTNQEIAFDLKESISFDGDSGPYLLYTYARCRSVLRRAAEAQSSNVKTNPKLKGSNLDFELDLTFGFKILDFNSEERAVARRIAQFPEVVADAAARFAPNTLCTYLFHLAAEFNLFYAKHTILPVVIPAKRSASRDPSSKNWIPGQARNDKRLALTAATAQILKNGLYLLGISTVERM